MNLCAGINHMGWFLKIEKDGQDLYPILREKFEKPEYYVNEKSEEKFSGISAIL